MSPAFDTPHVRLLEEELNRFVPELSGWHRHKMVKRGITSVQSMTEWLEKNLQGRYYWNTALYDINNPMSMHLIFFEDQEDSALFTLTWIDDIST